MRPLRHTHTGFTLIELLLVIGIIAVLASMVILAINPTKQLGNARDAQRRSDVKTILDAVYQYVINNNGGMPTAIPLGITQQICRASATTCVNGVNLNKLLSGAYLVQIPQDPQVAVAGTGTNYFIFQDANSKRLTVTAPGQEQTPGGISVTR